MGYEPKKLERWTMPDSYFGPQWPEYFVGIGRHRDSDDLAESNFAEFLKELGGETETVFVVRESHWAVGWIEWVAIHESDFSALEKADTMKSALEEYPVLNETDWSEREQETANEIWANCYGALDRVEYIREHRSQFDFHDWRDMRQCVKGEYFNGYASELIG